jgi:hypothetical protein
MNEQALKERIRHIAKEEKRTFQDVWKTLLLERLLARLTQSIFSEQFIFKGGMLLAHYIDICRETKDVYFLARIMNVESRIVQAAFEEICNLALADGFTFSFSDIATLDHHHMNYPGFRVLINVHFGAMKDRIRVDIGVGDVVEPRKESLELYQYKGRPIFEGGITLQVYPLETIFAEKLETIVTRGAANSRMKDFHDLFLISREKDLLNLGKLRGDIHKTFENRGTQKVLPLNFAEKDLQAMQRLWSAHLRGLGPVARSIHLPERMDELVQSLNAWLMANKIP